MKNILSFVAVSLLVLLMGAQRIPGPGGTASGGGGSPCTALPYTDNFTTTGALNSLCWTAWGGSYVPLTVVSSGVVQSTSSSTYGVAYFSGLTAGSTPELDAHITSTSWNAGTSGYPQVCLANVSTGNAECTFPTLNQVCTTSLTSGGCSNPCSFTAGTPSAGDVYQIGWNGSSFYGGDLTTSSICTIAGTAITSPVWVLVDSPTTQLVTFGPATVH